MDHTLVSLYGANYNVSIVSLSELMPRLFPLYTLRVMILKHLFHVPVRMQECATHQAIKKSDLICFQAAFCLCAQTTLLA